jgi:hypothetical protein
MKSVLFVCYGSGHVRMVLPVARPCRPAAGPMSRCWG